MQYFNLNLKPNNVWPKRDKNNFQKKLTKVVHCGQILTAIVKSM